MIVKLRKLFPSLIEYDVNSIESTDNYQWFITNQNKIVGIKQQELTEKDVQLLLAFLQPYNMNIPQQTDLELLWYDRIHRQGAKGKTPLKSPYRFVYFSMKKNQIEPILFKEAIHELFSKNLPIIWENEHEGIIVEQLSVTDEPINYEQIIDIIMADLYVKIKFFIGSAQYNLTNTDKYYSNLIKNAKIVFTHSDKAVINFIDVVPYILLNKASLAIKNEIVHSILNDFETDEEMLTTIEIFFQNNLNVSETAKKMYMHRNSLQYRLDKFINKTGINIQQFAEALTVYLAILAKRNI